jgi:hypothetical protein
MIPQDCFSTVSKTLFSLIPTPTASGYTNNLKSQITSAKTRQTSWGFNIDENLTTSQTIHFSFWRDSYNTPAFDHPGYFNNELSALKTEPRLGTGIFVTYAKTFSPNLVMTAGAGWMGEINNELNAHLGVHFAAVASGEILPTINFNGIRFTHHVGRELQRRDQLHQSQAGPQLRQQLPLQPRPTHHEHRLGSAPRLSGRR